MIKKDTALLVFTKTPIEGQVKTRLISNWGSEGALLLYKDLVKKTLETVRSTDIEDIYLFCTPDIKDPFIKLCSVHFKATLKLQSGGNLGEKMSNAFLKMLKIYKHVLIIGCDCPGITTKDINLAVSKLAEGLDVVLGPSKDGGYYLIGMSQSKDKLFEKIKWGESSVLSDTRRAISSLQLKSYELPERHDIDTPEDFYGYFNEI